MLGKTVNLRLHRWSSYLNHIRPDIRLALIRDGDHADPEAVGVHMLKHLSQKWTGPNGALSGTVASMNVADVVEKQAEQASFWALDSAFFDQYPQYSECQRPVDTLLEIC